MRWSRGDATGRTRHDRQPAALARRRPLRGRVHLRHGCRQHPAPLPPPQRRHPGRRDVGATLRSGGGGPPPRRPLPRVRHAADLLPAGVVHRTLPPSGGVDPERRPRDRPPPLPARACQRDVGRRGAVLVRAQHGRDREGHRPAPGRLPRRHLPVLAPHPRHPHRPRARLRCIPVRRRRPLRARERPRLGHRAAQPLRPRRLAALPVLTGLPDHDAGQSAAQATACFARNSTRPGSTGDSGCRCGIRS